MVGNGSQRMISKGSILHLNVGFYVYVSPCMTFTYDCRKKMKPCERTNKTAYRKRIPIDRSLLIVNASIVLKYRSCKPPEDVQQDK